MDEDEDEDEAGERARGIESHRRINQKREGGTPGSDLAFNARWDAGPVSTGKSEMCCY